MARLLVKFKDRTIKALTLDRIDTFSIGRHSSHQLVIDNYAVSSRTDNPAYRRMLVESKDLPQPAAGPPAGVAFLAGGAGRLDLVKSVVTIGRTRRCDIVIGSLFSFLAGDPAAVISKTPQHHYLSHFSGWLKPKVNGRMVHRPVAWRTMMLSRSVR